MGLEVIHPLIPVMEGDREVQIPSQRLDLEPEQPLVTKQVQVKKEQGTCSSEPLFLQSMHRMCIH